MLGDPAFEYIVQKNEKLDSRTSCENDIKDPIQNYISINFSFPLQGGERSSKRGACYKCGERVESSIGAPLRRCAMANKWKVESLPQPYQLHLFRPGRGGCRVATGGVILC